MAVPRKQQISLIDTKYYHCISRCVRRAHLCGVDNYTGKSYEHRKQWIESKLFQISDVFCIDIAAYAVMSNHLHLVLRINEEKAKQMDSREVLIRWHRLFKGTLITQKFLNDELLSDGELAHLNEFTEVYRKRLSSISWFMRVLNEDIARRANKEDGCTGRFWEGRFKSQALLDEVALAACMTYVDLNPVRANMAESPNKSDNTSIKKRIEANQSSRQPTFLLPFSDSQKVPVTDCLPFDFSAYLELVNGTCESIRTNQNTQLNSTQSILMRVGVTPRNWLVLTTQFLNVFRGAAGRNDALQEFCEHLKLRRRASFSSSQRLLR